MGLIILRQIILKKSIIENPFLVYEKYYSTNNLNDYPTIY